MKPNVNGRDHGIKLDVRATVDERDERATLGKALAGLADAAASPDKAVRTAAPDF